MKGLMSREKQQKSKYNFTCRGVPQNKTGERNILSNLNCYSAEHHSLLPMS